MNISIALLGSHRISNVTCTDHVKDEVIDDAGCSVIEVLRSTHGFLDMIMIIG